jgi:hypothetical protein
MRVFAITVPAFPQSLFYCQSSPGEKSGQFAERSDNELVAIVWIQANKSFFWELLSKVVDG